MLSLIFTGCLFVSSFLATSYASDMTSQQVLTKSDNILWNLAGLAVFALLFALTQKFVSQNAAKRLPLLFYLLCAWCLAIGAVLILFSKTVPAADAMSVYSAAEALASGDTSVIHPTDSYLSYYPHQVGLMSFFELMIRMWRLFPSGLHAYHAIKCIYVLLAIIIILFQYRTIRLFGDDPGAGCGYLLLMGWNLPFLMYTSFVYGEIPSFAAVSIGIYYLIRLVRGTASDSVRLTARHFLLSLLFLTLSVLLRQNALVVIIAVLIVTLFQSLRQHRPLLLLFAALCAVCSLSVLPIVQKTYEHRAGSSLSAGAPPISYLAMGMQESSRGKGWHNGFDFVTYQESGLDTQAASAVSRAAIMERLDYFKAHPKYAADFYLYKYLSQWVDGTYACRQATLATFGGRQEFFNSLYVGELSKYFITYGNHYQNLIYLGAFLFCLGNIAPIGRRRGKASWQTQKPLPAGQPAAADALSGLPLYLGLIAVFGGFWFHMAWEANARYIFPYSLLLVPYAACGLNRFLPRGFHERRRP